MPEGLVVDTYAVILGGITVFSLGDMVLYNRRKKRDWYAEQHEKWQQALALARQARTDGTANDEQILLLNRQEATEVAERERKNKPSWWKWTSSMFSSGGLKKEDKGFSRMENAAASIDGSASISPSEVPDIKDSPSERTMGSQIVAAVEEKRRASEKTLESTAAEPGPLDKLPAQATTAIGAQSSRSASSFWSNLFPNLK